MFWGLGFVLTSLVSSEIEYSVLRWQQDDCADNNPEKVTAQVPYTGCESLLEEFITSCESGGYDFCHLYQFDVCISAPPGAPYGSFMYECDDGTCYDDIMNGNEEGVDCGGRCSLACPTCNDGIMNGNEDGVDCGGDCSLACCPNFNCGESHVLKDNPETIYCATSPCTDLDFETCCDQRADCWEYRFGCLDDSYAERYNPQDHYCASTVCETSDHDTCCAKRATCENNYKERWCSDLNPDGTRFPYDDYDQHYCRLETCMWVDDQDNCCDKGPSCSTMSCNYTEGLTLVTNHAEILCPNLICDVGTCCTERASCVDFACEDREIYVDKYPWDSSWDSSLCHGVNCSTDWNSTDWSNCCLEKETCKNDDRTYVCPEKNGMVDDPTNVHCTNLTCSSPQDDLICCLPAKCSNDDVVICNSNTHYVNETAYCEGLTCTLQDEAECCIGSPCSEYSGCDGDSQITNPDRNCAFIACSNNDHDTCCLDRAPCTEFDCPSCETPVDRGYCAETSCVSTDSVTCSCVERGLVMNGTVGRYVQWSFESRIECQGNFTDLDSTKTLVADFFDIPCHWVMEVREEIYDWLTRYHYTIFLSTTNDIPDYGDRLFNQPSEGWDVYERSEAWTEALTDFTNGEWCGDSYWAGAAWFVDYTPEGSSGGSGSGLSVGAIIGIVVGAVVVIAVIGVLIFKSRPKRL